MRRPLPPELVEQTASRVAAWREMSRAPVPDELLATLTAVFASSDFVAGHCIRDPALPGVLLQAPAGTLPGVLSNPPTDEDAFMRLLRTTRNREMTRIAWRDLTGESGLEQTLQDLSSLAEACIRVALEWAQGGVEKEHGLLRDSSGAPQQLVVVAMGKLGGGELNFSSDVDLVLLYPESGDSDGARPLNSERYFARVGQRLIRALEHPTQDGFVFRVDTRLRPFGSTGALALSFAAFETYLQQHGREWERYAYIKARPLTGRQIDRQQFLELVRPFVYRRYLDYGVLESLREMKALIAADVSRRDRHDDIKLGPGGIREIEFIAQSFQLLRGGADPVLREPSLLSVLPALAERGWLDSGVVDELQRSYEFLRRVENRLQAWRDEQTHRLPQDLAGRARIAFAMGFDAWTAFARELDGIRNSVTRHFEAVVPLPPDDSNVDLLQALWKADPTSEPATEHLIELGFDYPEIVQRQLQVVRESGQYQRLDERGRRRLDSLIPKMLRLAGPGENADESISRLLNVVTAIGGRSAYFALLNENPAVLERLNELCTASSWLASRVAERPILLDELIDPRVFEAPAARPDLAADLQQRFVAVADDDLERQMESLRLFQQASVFRVAVSDLSGILPLMKVSDRLTDIAELVLEKTIEAARREMKNRFGTPRCTVNGNEREAGFAVIGYGKLGGLELGYASDLDLVLLHDSSGERQESDGARSLDNTRYFARLGQRILHMLNTTTSAGVLYEVDMRLRPSGKGGPLVSSISAFEKYQLDSAWTWEHQALLRARAVAGDPSARERFEEIRSAVLTQERATAKLRDEVLAMRQRMRRELPGGGVGQFDIKRDPGGLTDIEFLVQYWVLAHAAAHPALIRWSDNIRQLESLAEAGIVDARVAAEMTDIYRRYRSRLHRQALADGGPKVADANFTTEREWVRRQWAGVFGD
ncbi:MAG: bifunctional [glutamate--ammonia ligase]-adenylyl-L-tyrosine phosphorylase/[glutamate--ammonia-ligase] adenylyltransferase [Gammaproteobacteria bacterium]|nr:bifunctional [glutamate--ammonia ligase]-adenylyl-L-tyrosine phosphorylase/[glutamate--ammonia-ligase] adenylyltransferase [Gammaproteobacteria bacterium]